MVNKEEMYQGILKCFEETGICEIRFSHDMQERKAQMNILDELEYEGLIVETGRANGYRIYRAPD